jgi:5'-3' exonuclease
LALVGDSADGFPGIAGWGKQSASSVLAHYEHLEAIPDRAVDWEPAVRRAVRNASTLAVRLSDELEHALLFRVLATLRVEPWVLSDVSDLAWQGPTTAFDDICAHLRDPALADRIARVHARR